MPCLPARDDEGRPRRPRFGARRRALWLAAAAALLLSSAACGESSDDNDPSAGNGGQASGSTSAGSGDRPAGSGGSEGGADRGGADADPPTAGTTSGGTGGDGIGEAGSSGAGASKPSGPCHVEIACADPVQNEPKVLCAFEVRDEWGSVVYSDHAGVELRGNSSLRYPKKNYGLELRTAADADHPENLLGMGKEADWILDGSWLDRSFLRNDLVFELFRDAGYYAPESRYCTLTLNSKPQGIYRLVERIKRDNDRVKLMADDGTGQTFVIRQDAGGALEFALGAQPFWKMVYPKQETATPAQIAGVQTWLDGLTKALATPASSNAQSGIFEFLDFDATIDWILIQELAKNIDAYNVSVHFTREAAQHAKFVAWDLDLAFGQPISGADRGRGAHPEGWIEKRSPFIVRLSAVPALRTRLAARWRELRAEQLTTEHVLEEFETLAAKLDPEALVDNFALWPIDEVDASRVDAEYTLYPVTSHDDELTQVRAWLEARLSWIDANIDDYPN